MIPMVLDMEIIHEKGKKIRLWLPLFLIWILLLPLFVLVFAVLVIAGIIAWITGYGRSVLAIIPLICESLWNLGGLKVDVEGEEEKVFIEFR